MAQFRPEYSHEYKAVEISMGKPKGKNFTFNVSYVISKSEGNYTGFYDQDYERANPGNNLGLQTRVQIHNSYGTLPNDHRHSIKINAAYKFNFGFSAGTFFSYLSGGPLNEWGTGEMYARNIYLQPRGTAGRLPDLWDLSMRLTYDLKINKLNNRIFLDIYHIGSPQRITQKDQTHYLWYLTDLSGNPIRNEYSQPVPDPETVNDNYGNATGFQPPMMVRFGLEMNLK